MLWAGRSEIRAGEKRVHRPGGRSQPEERPGEAREAGAKRTRRRAGEGPSRPDEELGFCSEISVMLCMISVLKLSLELC